MGANDEPQESRRLGPSGGAQQTYCKRGLGPMSVAPPTAASAVQCKAVCHIV